MKKEQKDKYILFEAEGDVAAFATALSREQENFKDKNIVVNLLNHNNCDEKELLMFLEVSNKHRLGKRSFVVASKEISIDDLPEELVVVPTLQEAEDIVNMEELERELGF